MFIVLFGVSYMLALIESGMVINFLLISYDLSNNLTLSRQLGLCVHACVCGCLNVNVILDGHCELLNQ